MEPNSEYTSWVAELREKQQDAQAIVTRIEDGHARKDDHQNLRKLTAEVKGLARKVEAYREASSLAEFKAFEAVSSRRNAANPAYQSGLTNLGAIKTETEILDEATFKRYSSFERELGSKKFQAVADPEFKRIAEKALRFGYSGLSDLERKAIDSGADERGAITAPVDVLNFIVGRLNAPTRIAGNVREINTSRDSIQFYRNAYDSDDEYTNSFRRVKTGSKPASSTEANVMTATDRYIEPVKIQVHTMMMVGQIENDLLEDSTFDLMGWFQDEISKSAAQDRDNDIINGNGVGCPMGIINYIDATAYGNFKITSVKSGSNSTLTESGLSELLWDLPEQYIENSRIVMKRTEAGKVLAKLRTTNGDRIFGNPGSPNGASLVGPSGQELEGYPIIWSSKMPSVAQNKFPILFGDLSGYVSLTRSNISIKILDQTRATQNMTEVVAKIRYGGDLVEPYKFRAQKVTA